MLKIQIDFHIHVHVRREGSVSTEKKNECLQSGVNMPFAAYVEKQIVRLRELGRFSTARNYQTALRSFLEFCGHRPLSFSEFTSTLTADYERWLKNRVTLSTVSCYLRSLRAIL